MGVLRNIDGNKGLKFDGVNDFVSGSMPDFSILPEISFSFWYNQKDLTITTTNDH